MLSHVAEFDVSAAGAVCENIAVVGMELGGCDDLAQLLHVSWFDVDYVETLVGDAEIPQVDPQVIRAHKRLKVTVQRY